MSAEWGVWVDAPYGFALRVTQPGQPGKLFKTNNSDLGKSYLRTLHRATARGERGTEQQARAAWKPAGAVPPAHSFRGLVVRRLTPGPAVRGCPRRKQLAASDQKLLLPCLAPLAPLLLLQSRPRFRRAEKSWPSLLQRKGCRVEWGCPAGTPQTPLFRLWDRSSPTRLPAQPSCL